MSSLDNKAHVHVPFSLDEIKQTLEEDIALGYLHPKQRLVEDEIMERFNTKRHLVRQALIDLEVSGLVERRRNVGAFVKDYSIKEVFDLYVVRIILETSAIDNIKLPVCNKKIEPLVEIQKQHDLAAEVKDLRQTFRFNVAFHKAFFALTENPTLQQCIDELAQRAHMIRFLSMTEPSYLNKARSDHWQLIELLRTTDRNKLKSLCENHLTPSRDAYIERYKTRTETNYESFISSNRHLS